MITDFNLAGSNVFELFFRRLETNSFNENTVKFNADTNTSHKYSSDRDLIIEGDGKNKFIINNKLGSINITGEDRDDIDIKAKITVYSDKKTIAESYAKKIEIKSLKKDDKIEMKVPLEDKPEEVKGVKIDYLIKAPKSMYLELDNQFGILEVTNFTNGVDLSNRYQESIIKNIAGEDIVINNKFGSLNLSNVSEGKVMKITTAYNKTNIENIKRNMEINASYGDTNFYNTKGIILDSKYTDVEFDGINGQLKANIKYGNIRVSDVKYDTEIEGKYAEVTVELARELENYEIEGKTKYGDIRTNLNKNIRKEDKNKRKRLREGAFF